MIDDQSERWIGETIADRYRGEEVLGGGASGIVLRCHHIELNLEVAVKLLHPEIARHPDAVSGFLALAQETSRLDHPNCAQVLDYGEWRRGAASVPYVTTPFTKGGSLAERMDGPVPPRRVLELARQIVDGLAHAHGNGLVHGHVCARNVLVAKDGKGEELLKLVDFGHETLAEQARNALGVERHDELMPHYASPEMAMGTPIDARTDIYCVGLLLHHLLCGAPTFDAEDPPHLLSLHAFADPPQLPEFIPMPLRGLVARMLAKSPDDRPQSAADLARFLDQVANLLSNRRTMQFGSFAMAAIAKSMAPVLKLEEASRGGDRPSVPLREAVAPQAVAPQSVAPQAGAKPRFGPQRTELQHPTIELRSPTTRLPNWTDAQTEPNLGQHKRAWLPLAAAALALVGVVTWVVATSEDDPVRASTDQDFAAVRDVIAERFGAESEADPSAPPPGEPRAPRGGPQTELIEIDGLLKKGANSAAMARIDRMLREHPEEAGVHLRRARALASEEDGARAIAAYDDALDRDPALLDDEEIRAEIGTLLQRPELHAPALELVLHRFGDHRDDALVHLVNDEANPLSYRDRQRALATITADSSSAEAVDRVLTNNLDLWQARESDTPCLVFAAALARIEQAPSPTYLGTLHRVTPPPAALDADMNTAALCAVLPARLEAVRTSVAKQFPMSPSRWTVPTAYATTESKNASADATHTAIVPAASAPIDARDAALPDARLPVVEAMPVAIIPGA
jgi:serine/threonine protein kinase